MGATKRASLTFGVHVRECKQMSALGDADMDKFLDRSSTLLISTSVPPESIRPSPYKAQSCITGHEFGCCAVCSTNGEPDEPRQHLFRWCGVRPGHAPPQKMKIATRLGGFSFAGNLPLINIDVRKETHGGLFRGLPCVFRLSFPSHRFIAISLSALALKSN